MPSDAVQKLHLQRISVPGMRQMHRRFPRTVFGNHKCNMRIPFTAVSLLYIYGGNGSGLGDPAHKDTRVHEYKKIHIRHIMRIRPDIHLLLCYQICCLVFNKFISV